MSIYKLLVTRQLAGYSGDLYINVDAIADFQALYAGIMSGSINNVNAVPPIADAAGLKVKFRIIDSILNKPYDVHIKKNVGNGTSTGDGLRFTLTKYIKDMSITPSQFLVIYLVIDSNSCTLFLNANISYKYILEKHKTEDLYRIIMDEVPDKYPNIERISDNTNAYLERFNIRCTADNSLKWQSTNFMSYESENNTKKYIGVPYKPSLECDYFDKIEDII
ncbi:hypothetical protein [Sulfurimonas sp.]